MKNEFKEDKKEVNGYLKYSGIGFQIMAICGAGFFIGYQLDKWLHTPQPYFTLVFSLVFIVLALYTGLKDFAKKK